MSSRQSIASQSDVRFRLIALHGYLQCRCVWRLACAPSDSRHCSLARFEKGESLMSCWTSLCNRLFRKTSPTAVHASHKASPRRRSAARVALELMEERLVPVAGALDLGFGAGGMAFHDLLGSGADEGRAVIVQEDSKIVLAGNSGGHISVVRYNGDGSLDDGFGAGGRVVLEFGVSYGGSAVAADYS